MSDKINKVIEAAVKVREAFAEIGKHTAIDDLVHAVDAAEILSGEPELLFIVRPKDLVAIYPMKVWLLKAEDVGAPAETLEEVRRKMHAVERWQQVIEDMRHVKVPT